MKSVKSDVLRILILAACMAALLVTFVFRLAQVQIADGASYLAQQQAGDKKVQTVRAARGEIVDRNGSPLAHNETIYNITLDKALLPTGRENETIKSVLGILRDLGDEWIDNLPLECSESGKPVFTADSDAAISRLKKTVGINDYATADDVYYWLCERYSLSDYDTQTALAIAGVRYEMERVGYSLETRYTLAEDVSQDAVVLLSQIRSALPGVEVEESAKRTYPDGALAPHIIGTLGAITSDELDTYLAQGYSMNERIGKSGIEKVYESTLRGTDGERVITRDADYNIISVEETKTATPGNTIMLTIDKKIQQVAYDALAAQIKNLQETAESGKGKEANAGAVAVIDIKNSELLAAATYPSYDLASYAENFTELSEDPLNPLFNRAISGVYAPGSTFKPTVAVAGLTEGVITPESIVRCNRVYTFFQDYQPTCLSNHGNMTVIDALRASCNIFFYDTGRQLGIATINKYAQSLGLGVATGIELSEAIGTQCDPESDNPGDVLQASIGQLDNGYSPIQLANYTATIARQGERRRLSIVHAITSYQDYNDVISMPEHEILSTVDADDEVWDTVFQGMINATHATNGTAYRYLGDYPLTVASKTGTPQTKEFPNSTFICFAPAEDPQIAIAVVIEKGWHGYTGAPVARAIMDAYFFPEEEEEESEPAITDPQLAVEETETPAVQAQ